MLDRYKSKFVFGLVTAILILISVSSNVYSTNITKKEKNVIEQIQKEINKQDANWIAGETSISNLSDIEMKRLLGVYVEESDNSSFEDEPKASDAPDSFDWRNIDGIDYTTPIKNQADCGSCVAFGVISALESYLKSNSDNLYNFDLSEGHLFFCGGGTCSGGWYLEDALYKLKYEGVPPETCLPYRSKNTECEDACDNWDKKVVKISQYRRAHSINNMKETIVNYGPIIVTFIVYEDFRYYTGGIYEHVTGSELGGHCVSIVGYNDDPGYWICKNSWGPRWGEQGYFRIKYKECEIYQGSYYLELGENNKPENPNYFYSNKTNVNAGESISFTAKSIDPDNDGIYYFFDWGDGSNSGWLPPNSSGEIYEINHTWSVDSTKNYNIRVKSMDVYGLEGGWSKTREVNINNNPPTKPTIEKMITEGNEYYKVVSSDPENHLTYYFFDWVDGSDSGWIGPYESEEPCKIERSHDALVKVKAKDEHGAESEWAEKTKSKKSKGFFKDLTLFSFFKILSFLKNVNQKNMLDLKY